MKNRLGLHLGAGGLHLSFWMLVLPHAGALLQLLANTIYIQSHLHKLFCIFVTELSVSTRAQSIYCLLTHRAETWLI